MSDQLDLSGYSSANGAAKAAARKLRDIAEELGQDPEAVTVEKVDGRFGEHWAVSWREGPVNWAVVLTGGESLFADENPSVRQGQNEPQITGFHESDGFHIECTNGHTLAFYLGDS